MNIIMLYKYMYRNHQFSLLVKHEPFKIYFLTLMPFQTHMTFLNEIPKKVDDNSQVM